MRVSTHSLFDIVYAIPVKNYRNTDQDVAYDYSSDGESGIQSFTNRRGCYFMERID